MVDIIFDAGKQHDCEKPCDKACHVDHDDDSEKPCDNAGCDDDDGLPAYSHHDRFPPWWVFVCDDNGGNMSGDKIPPLMMIMIRHLTHFNLSRSFVMLLPDCIDTALNTPRQKTISHILKF